MKIIFKPACFFLLFNFVLIKSFAQPSGAKVIAYYFDNPAALDSFDVKKLDEIIFSFGRLQGNQFHIRSARDTATIQKMVALKAVNPALKVVLSLGGWGGCETCSDVFASRKNSKEFAKEFRNVADYFKTDGLDLDWEYPAVSGFPGHKFTPDDRKHFTRLVKFLRRSLGKEAELSFAAGVSKKVMETGMEWKKVMKKTDRVNLMTYDLAGPETPNTAHHTLLYSTAQQPVSTDYAVQYLLNLGIPAEKIVIGAAFYGKIWENVPDTANGLYQPAKFKITVQYKTLVRDFTIANGFNYYWDSIASAPYLYNPAQKLFVTFDDKRSVQTKTKYVIDKKLGGIMFWQLTEDTFQDGLLDAIDATRNVTPVTRQP
jgi:chitinase